MKGMKGLSFGTSRLTEGIKAHEDALRLALANGIKVIDTSGSYGGGGSQRLVGSVLASLPKDARQEVAVVTKVGYRFLDGKLTHSFTPEFIQSELHESIARVGSVATLIVDSPERILHPLVDNLNKARAMRSGLKETTAPNSANPSPFIPEELRERSDPVRGDASMPGVDEAQAAGVEQAEVALAAGKKAMIDSLRESFEALEFEVRNGTIKSYGVASEALVLSSDDPLFLDWKELVAAGRGAAGSSGCGLGVLQVPVNILEPRGVEVSIEARAQGLRVMGLRPLTTVLGGTWAHLIDFEAGPAGDPLGEQGYMAACQAALAHFDFELPERPTGEEEEIFQGCRWVRQLIEDLNKGIVKFESVAQYEAELSGAIMPLLDAKFEELDDISAQVLTRFFTQVCFELESAIVQEKYEPTVESFTACAVLGRK